ncbi:MAG: AMP-ligase, partial [Rhodanobacter sp.]
MAIVQDIRQRDLAIPQLPLLAAGELPRTLAWRDGQPISAAQFIAHVEQVAALLPNATAAVNLCEDRYAFLVAFCAIALCGQTNLLPSSRAPQAVDEVMATHPGSYALGDQLLDPAPLGYRQLPTLELAASTMESFEWPMIPADQVVAIGYT